MDQIHGGQPLITYPEWIAIAAKSRVLLLEEQGGAISGWKFRGMSTEGKRKWLMELGRYPGHGPARTSTVELGLIHLRREEESITGTEINEGETVRDMDLIERKEGAETP